MLLLRHFCAHGRSADHLPWVLAVLFTVTTALAVSCNSYSDGSQEHGPSSRPTLSADPQPNHKTDAVESANSETRPASRVQNLMAPREELGPWDYDDGLTASGRHHVKTCNGAGDIGRPAPQDVPVDLMGSSIIYFEGAERWRLDRPRV